MLELRPNCECCNDLPAESADARIYSFECTFCASCAEVRLNGKCPNCGGELVSRPRRPIAELVDLARRGARHSVTLYAEASAVSAWLVDKRTAPAVRRLLGAAEVIVASDVTDRV